MTQQEQIKKLGYEVQRMAFEGFCTADGKAFSFKVTPGGNVRKGTIKRDVKLEAILNGNPNGHHD